MAINFPNTPTIGQQITGSAPNIFYTWDGTAWTNTPISASIALTASITTTLSASSAITASFATIANQAAYRVEQLNTSDATSVAIDNYRFRVPATGNRSLQITTVNGSATLNGMTEAIFRNGVTLTNQITNLVINSSNFTYLGSFNFTVTGNVQRAYFYDNNQKAYKITYQFQTGYTNSNFVVERMY